MSNFDKKNAQEFMLEVLKQCKLYGISIRHEEGHDAFLLSTEVFTTDEIKSILRDLKNENI